MCLKRVLNSRICHNYSKRINYCYMIEQCAINFKIPLTPPFSKGEIPFSPLWKRGVRGDFVELELMRLY